VGEVSRVMKPSERRRLMDVLKAVASQRSSWRDKRAERSGGGG
jgi:hypothetical protein